VGGAGDGVVGEDGASYMIEKSRTINPPALKAAVERIPRRRDETFQRWP
jgi:hypothetical protein